MKHASTITLWVTAFVFLAVWCAQTDNFPVQQGVRPSWYVYGWPFCFATSSRGRFNFTSFDTRSLIADGLISLLLITSTWFTSKHLISNLPTFSITQMIAATTGIAFVFLFVSGAVTSFYGLLNFPLPHEMASAMAGNARRWERISLLSKFALCIGIFSAAYMITILLAQRFGWHNNQRMYLIQMSADNLRWTEASLALRWA